MIDDPFTPKEIETMQQQISDSEVSPSLLQVMKAGISEGWESGPSKALHRYFTAANAPKDMTGEQANAEYGIADTEIAYKPDEKVSSVSAKIAAERYFERRANEAMVEQASKESPFLAPALNMVGSLGMSAADPTNIVIGLATGGIGYEMGVARMGAMSTTEMTKHIARSMTMKQVFKRQLAENFAASLITDAAIIPLGEKVTREKVSTEQRIFNILGATVLGGVVGTAMEIPSVATARRNANKLTNQHGAAAEGIAEQSKIKLANDASKNVKPNPDHVVKLKDMEFYIQRPDQSEYKYSPLDNDNIKNQTFYIGKRKDKVDLDQDSIVGDNSLFIVDHHNVAHNRVASLSDEYTGEVFELRLSEDSKILTDVAEVKTDLYTRLDDSMGLAKKGIKEEDFDSVADLVDLIHENIDDFKGVPNIDNIMNETLSDMGYDGYLRTKSPVTQPDVQYNGVVLFDRKAFEVGEAGLSHNSKYFSAVSKVGDAEFNPNHPEAPDFLKQFRDLETEEQMRMSDVKSQMDYDENAAQELAKEKRPYSAEQDDFQNAIDDDGISEAELAELSNDPETASNMKAAKDPEYFAKAVEAFDKCRSS